MIKVPPEIKSNLEREERRRYGAPAAQEGEKSLRATLEPEFCERRVHASCQNDSSDPVKPQDPDPVLELKIKSRSRYVPAAVRREVFMRDGGQCTFVDRAGRRCEQRHFLELDHREAFAIGGSETAENLRIRCHAHNALEAEKLFGQKRIRSAIAHFHRKRTD